jgi:hypothetical protein
MLTAALEVREPQLTSHPRFADESSSCVSFRRHPDRKPRGDESFLHHRSSRSEPRGRRPTDSTRGSLGGHSATHSRDRSGPTPATPGRRLCIEVLTASAEGHASGRIEPMQRGFHGGSPVLARRRSGRPGRSEAARGSSPRVLGRTLDLLTSMSPGLSFKSGPGLVASRVGGSMRASHRAPSSPRREGADLGRVTRPSEGT